MDDRSESELLITDGRVLRWLEIKLWAKQSDAFLNYERQVTREGQNSIAFFINVDLLEGVLALAPTWIHATTRI